MGDNFQIIADVDAAEAEAPALAASVVSWLAGAGIIAADPADCVLGTGPGYPPGPLHAAAVATPDPMLLRLRTNGVEVHTTKTVFCPVQGELGPVACPGRGQVMVLEDPATGQTAADWDLFSDALDKWQAGEPRHGHLPTVPAGVRPQRLALDRRLDDRRRLPRLHLLELARTKPVVHHPGRNSPGPPGCRHPGQALTARVLTDRQAG